MGTTWRQHEDNVETIWEQCGDHRDVETTWDNMRTMWRQYGNNVGTTGMWRPHGDNMETTWGQCGDHGDVETTWGQHEDNVETT